MHKLGVANKSGCLDSEIKNVALKNLNPHPSKNLSHHPFKRLQFGIRCEFLIKNLRLITVHKFFT